MKAEISRDGLLTVYPESALETYALTMWQIGFNEIGNAALRIALDEEPCDLPLIADLRGDS